MQCSQWAAWEATRRHALVLTMSARWTLKHISKTILRDDARWSPEDPIFIRWEVPLVGAATASLTRRTRCCCNSRDLRRRNVCNSSCVMTLDSTVVANMI